MGFGLEKNWLLKQSDWLMMNEEFIARESVGVNINVTGSFSATQQPIYKFYGQ